MPAVFSIFTSAEKRQFGATRNSNTSSCPAQSLARLTGLSCLSSEGNVARARMSMEKINFPEYLVAHASPRSGRALGASGAAGHTLPFARGPHAL